MTSTPAMCTSTKSQSVRKRQWATTESTRAQFRMQRQAEIEKEQKKEEAEALRQLMDQSQHQHLVRSLSAVKTEFSDLDGVKWSGAMLRRRSQRSTPTIKVYSPSHPELLRPHLASDTSPSLAPNDASIVECTPLASTFSERDLERPPIQDETIRISDARRRYRTNLPSSNHSPRSPTFPEIKSVQSLSPRLASSKVTRPFEEAPPFYESDGDETICIPIHPTHAATASSSPPKVSAADDSASLTVRASRVPLKSAFRSDSSVMVGRVFCREYEYGPDGQRKQGSPGRWHAVEGLRVELS